MDLHDACAARGLFYPPDPASWKFCTIGGNVAENAGGMRAVKYGVTRDYVMGLQVVLADGSVLETGGKARAVACDLTGLFTGSEGTLGVITRILLRLVPLPKARGVVRVLFRTMDDGCAAVRAMLQEGLVPSAAEIMDETSLQAVAATSAWICRRRPGPASCWRSTAETRRPWPPSRAAWRPPRPPGQPEFREARSAAEAEQLWAVRRGLSSAVSALAPDWLPEDISVPRAAFPEVVRRIRAIAGECGLAIPVFGHAGDGNLHPSVLYDAADPGQAERARRAVDAVIGAALAVGGTLTGEHGVGLTKRPTWSRPSAPPESAPSGPSSRASIPRASSTRGRSGEGRIL